MNYTEAPRRSRQMSGGMTKTALEGWQRAGLGATGGGLLAYTMASLINPSMSRRGKILSTLAGMGTGAAAGYRFLPGYESGKTPAGTGNAGNAGNATTDTSTPTTQAQAPAQTAAKAPAQTPAQTQAPAPTKAPAQTAAQAPAQAPAQRSPRKLTPDEVERYGRRANNIINSIVEANEPFARDLPRLTLQYGPAAPVLTTLAGAGKRVLEAQMHKARAHRNGWDIGRTHLSLVPDDRPEPWELKPAQAPTQPRLQAPAQATEPGPAENLGSLGTAPAVGPAPAATPAPAPAPAPTATPATASAAAPAATGQEDDDVSGAVYRTLGGLGLGLGGAGLYAGNRALKNRRVRQFGARRQQVRENQDTYAAWNAALEELAHRPQVATPSVPTQAASQDAAQVPAQTAAGGGKATTMSVEDLRREQEMEYRSRMRLDPDVLPDITHFDPAGYQLDKMGPRNAAKFLREISLGFNPFIPREEQLEALQSAFKRNAEQVLRYDAPYWPFMIRNRIKEKAINALKKDDWRFKAHLKTDVGERGYDKALFNSDYIPIRLQNGKYSLRKISPFETHDPISASEIDESERYRAVMRGTHDVWDAKQYGGRLVPNREGEVYGWVPEMAPIHEPKPARAARLARAVSAGSKVLSILLKTLDN